MNKLHPLPCFAVAASLAACGPAPVPETPPAPAPPPPAPSGPVGVFPARWLYRHVETLTPSVSRKLPGAAGVLHASASGERWITPATPAPPAPAPAADADGGAAGPRLDTAPTILPEPIVAILPVEQRFVFFGASGRAYVAATPLGAVDEVRQPPSPFRAVSGGSAAAIAVTRGGDLLRSTDGGTHWSAVSAAGLSPAAAYSIAMRTDGAGVVLAAPQRALVTADDGGTWAPLAVPAGGPHVLQVSEEGELWLANDGYNPVRTHRLEGKPPAFAASKAPPRVEHGRKDRVAARYEADSDTQRALAGKRVLNVGRPYSGDPWKVEISDLDQEGEWKVLPELEGCQGSSVAAAAFGDDLVLGCARARDKDKDVAALAAGAPAPPPYRMVFYRSKDAGASWAEDGDVPLWDAWARVLAGPDGWLLVQRRCKPEPGECKPFAFRTGAGQPFSTLEVTADTNYGPFAVDAPRRRLVALSAGGKPKATRFHAWSLDGHLQRTTDVFSPASSARGAITVDEHGAVVVAALAPTGEPPKGPGRPAPEVWKMLRSSDEGATFESARLGPEEMKVRDVVLAGDRGLLADQGGHFWETASAGKTWVPVTGLPRRNPQATLCGRDGCVIGAERRLGWDLATDTTPPPAVAAAVDAKPPEKVPGATPLKCVAGEARPIPRAIVDDLDELVATGSGGGRLTVPAATKTNGVELVVLSTSEKGLAAKATAFFDAAPNPAAVGSHTDVLMTSGGVVGTRATYPVDRGGADVWISPVTAEVAWWRPQVGKVVHSRLPPLGKGHMRGTFMLGARNDRGELLWLLPDGVVFRPHYSYPDATEIFSFGDKGAPGKINSGVLQSARSAVRTPAGLTLLDLGWGDAAVARFAVARDRGKDKGKGKDKDRQKEAEPQTAWTLAPPGSGPSVVPIQRGDEGALVVAWSGPPDGPPRGFLVPMRPGDAPAEVTDLGLAALLVEKPRVCGDTQDPGAVRLRLSLPRAARRPVLVEGGEKPALLRAEAVVVVVSPQGQSCVSEWIARGGDGAELTVIPVAAPQRAWSITATANDSPYGTRTRDLTVRAARCEEAAGLAIPASFDWKGF